MIRPRARAAFAIVAAAACVAGAALALRPPPRDKPTLLLMTSLPLMFGERFSLDAVGSPVLDRLEPDYKIEPIAAAEPASLAKGELLLMAHPRAQPAELLVALDDWVRRGGRLLLLADPKLDWPSQRPLGDMLRPPPYFADTGLLAHWGLVLEGPEPLPSGVNVQASVDVGKYSVGTDSPGSLRLVGTPECALAAGNFIARCRIGKGYVSVIADADFLYLGDGEAMPGRVHNPDFLLAELDSLSHRE